MKYILILLFVTSCSTSKDKTSSKDVEAITNSDFKKERAFTKAEVPDFYQVPAVSVNPALQDETLDRHSQDELDKLAKFKDPLIEISVHCSKRDFDSASQIANKNFDRYQKIPSYWNLVANCHLNQGSERKALLFYNKALEIDKEYVPALNNIGVMYSRQGESQKALVAFERASKAGKFSKTPRYNLAKLYLSFGLADLSLPVFQGLLNESPTDIDLLNLVASSHFLQSDYGRSMSYYQKIPQKFWSNPEIGLNLSITLLKLGKMQDAAKVFGLINRPGHAELKRYYDVVKSQVGDKK